MKIEFEGRRMKAHLRRKTWREGCQCVLFNATNPPDGYKIIFGIVGRRGKSGQAVNVTLEFAHCDASVAPLELEEAYALFDGPDQFTDEILGEESDGFPP